MDMQTWRDSRDRADNATTALREAFTALGVPDHVQQHIRPVITHSGTARSCTLGCSEPNTWGR